MKADLFLISTCSISTLSTIKSLSCFDFCVFLFHLLVWFPEDIRSSLYISEVLAFLCGLSCQHPTLPWTGE